MDVDSGVVIATSAITAGATLVGVLVTGVVGFFTEDARNRREALREDAREQQAEATRQREIAEGIADRFLNRLPALRRADPHFEMYFDEFFYEDWHANQELEFRREIGRLTDSEARENLIRIVESIGDSELASRRSQHAMVFVDELTVLGAELAQALVRRQELSTAVLLQLVTLKNDVGELREHRQQQAELERERRQEEKRRKQARKRRKAEGREPRAGAEEE